MSAKTVTEDEGTGREAVLRAMQEAAECAAGKNGVPKGYMIKCPGVFQNTPGVF